MNIADRLHAALFARARMRELIREGEAMRLQRGTHDYIPTRRGQVFEAVYTGMHEDCTQPACPCHTLRQPLRTDLEFLAQGLMKARGLTIEQARAAQLDW